MSDKQLYKKALFKNKKPPTQEEMEDEEDEEQNIKEEMKDQFNEVMDKFPAMGSGPIKAVHSIKPPTNMSQDQQNQQMPKPKNKAIHNYEPLSWTEFFDAQEYMENGTPVYRAGTEGCIFFCMHGAGDSAASFARLGNEIKKFSTLISFDFRGHGDSKVQENVDDLSVETLLQDAENVLRWVIAKYPDQMVVIVGHSMGGSIATKFCEFALKIDLAPKIQGLIVIDVVEGTAIDALPFMETLVKNRPSQFHDLPELIKWSLRSGTLRNIESARVSMPEKVYLTQDETGQNIYKWKVDLMKSWFKGLTGSFLSIRVPKILMLAEKERMDKELTIAQMQGKFKVKVIYNVGHYMQEDSFKDTAKEFHSFLTTFRLPQNNFEKSQIQTLGVGKFNPKVEPYE